MSHNLYIENGRASMMYVDEEPWHRLGTRLNEPVAVRAKSSEIAKLKATLAATPESFVRMAIMR